VRNLHVPGKPLHTFRWAAKLTLEFLIKPEAQLCNMDTDAPATHATTHGIYLIYFIITIYFNPKLILA